MKKVFSVLLSLFMLWGGVLISCSADAESNGGSASASEALKLIICDSQGDAKESIDLTYNKAEGTGGFFYVKSNYEDLSAYKITGISLVRTSDDNDTDITSKVNIEEKSRFSGYKIDFSSAVSNAGNYKIIVYAQKGSEKEVITLNLTVEAGSVNPEEKPTPEITKQPVSVQWKAGEDAIPLTVEATISSGTISYQWHKDGNPIDGATSASYTPDKTNGKGSYFVVVSNADSSKSVKSSQVSVTIVAEGELLPPVITANLAESASYDKVSDIKALSITATADGADIYYLWYKDGTAIGAPSTTASTYTPTVFGSYYCALYASKGEKTSQTINSKTITISESAITVNVSISPSTAYTGTELTASVDYNVESANVSYQWKKTDINSGNDTEISGATSETYTPTEAGRYYCKVTATSAINAKNTVTKTSTPVTVSVKQSDDPVMPVINNINERNSDFDLSVKEGGSFTLTVSASTTDSGALTYEWFKQGNTTSLGTGTSYSKSNVTSSDAGKYFVRVTNTLNGKTASTDSLKVTVTITSSEIGTGKGGFDFK